MRRFVAQLVALLVIAVAGAVFFWHSGTGAYTPTGSAGPTDSLSGVSSDSSATGAQAHVFRYSLHADFVRGGKGAQGPVCVANAVFHPGEEVVFRATVRDVATGLQPSRAAIKRRALTILVQVNSTYTIHLHFSPHPAKLKSGQSKRTLYWAGAWPIPKNFPFGPVTWALMLHDRYGDRASFAPIGQDVGISSIIIAPARTAHGTTTAPQPTPTSSANFGDG